ncbi:hypothetical protein GCM10011459_20110 [Limosilactobacillus caviae]|uniref:Uncharacterized protein n=1 Tax=Limosilactobacillus caviae TaxID=1769424 RepID=A0ABQ2C727_9LACO|nr:hypothetical protein GCM10011459_20110 [Limosilactobacillus caviae]
MNYNSESYDYIWYTLFSFHTPSVGCTCDFVPSYQLKVNSFEFERLNGVRSIQLIVKETSK